MPHLHHITSACTTWCVAVRCGTAWCSPVWYSTVQCGSIVLQCIAIQCHVMRCIALYMMHRPRITNVLDCIIHAGSQIHTDALKSQSTDEAALFLVKLPLWVMPLVLPIRYLEAQKVTPDVSSPRQANDSMMTSRQDPLSPGRVAGEAWMQVNGQGRNAAKLTHERNLKVAQCLTIDDCKYMQRI